MKWPPSSPSSSPSPPMSNHRSINSGKGKEQQLIRGTAAMKSAGLPVHMLQDILQCSYVNGKDFDEMFTLYRKLELNSPTSPIAPGLPIKLQSISVRDARLPKVDAISDEPAAPMLKRYARINQSGRFGGIQHHYQQKSPGTPPGGGGQRRMIKFQPCGSPIAELSGEDTPNFKNCGLKETYREDGQPGQGHRNVENGAATQLDYHMVHTNNNAGDYAIQTAVDGRSCCQNGIHRPLDDAIHQINQMELSAGDYNSLPWNIKYYQQRHSERLTSSSLGGSDDGNWQLRERAPDLQSTAINRSQIVVASPRETSSGLRGMFSNLHRGQLLFGRSESGLEREKFVTHGRLKLFKSNSLGRHNVIVDSVQLEKFFTSTTSTTTSCHATNGWSSSWGKNSTKRMEHKRGDASQVPGSIDPDEPWPSPPPDAYCTPRMHACEIFSHITKNNCTTTNSSISPPIDKSATEPCPIITDQPKNISGQKWCFRPPLKIPYSDDDGQRLNSPSCLNSPPELQSIPTILVSKIDSSVSSASTPSLSQNRHQHRHHHRKKPSLGSESSFGLRKLSHHDDYEDLPSAIQTPSNSSNSEADTASITSGSSCQSSLMHRYRSCPDLLQPCSLHHYLANVHHHGSHHNCTSNSMTQPPSVASTSSNHRSHTLSAEHRKHRRKKQSSWRQKPVKHWDMNDIITWLQFLGLNDVASLLIGYEFTGADLLLWTTESLDNLRINPDAQAVLLKELELLRKQRSQRQRKESGRHSPTRSLFPLLQQSANEETPPDSINDSMTQAKQILPVTLPPIGNIRQTFTIAEGHSGGLLVTKIRAMLPLRQGDCIIEINGHSTLSMASVDFNCLLHDGIANKLVVLRNPAGTENLTSSSATAASSPRSADTSSPPNSADSSNYTPETAHHHHLRTFLCGRNQHPSGSSSPSTIMIPGPAGGRNSPRLTHDHELISQISNCSISATTPCQHRTDHPNPSLIVPMVIPLPGQQHATDHGGHQHRKAPTPTLHSYYYSCTTDEPTHNTSSDIATGQILLEPLPTHTMNGNTTTCNHHPLHGAPNSPPSFSSSDDDFDIMHF